MDRARWVRLKGLGSKAKTERLRLKELDPKAWNQKFKLEGLDSARRLGLKGSVLNAQKLLD